MHLGGGCLASFTQFDYLEIHPCCNLNSSLILIVERQLIAWVDHCLFMHSTIDGHLNCFEFLVIINKFAVNIHVHIFGCIFSVHFISLVHFLGIKWLNNMVGLCLLLFSEGVLQFYNLNESFEVSIYILHTSSLSIT